jgi:MoxR-like ATPase
LLDYVQQLVSATRNNSRVELGLSPRAAIALLKASRAHAFVEKREYAIPEDVKAVFVATAGHRLRLVDGADVTPQQAAHTILEATPVP